MSTTCEGEIEVDTSSEEKADSSKFFKGKASEASEEEQEEQEEQEDASGTTRARRARRAVSEEE